MDAPTAGPHPPIEAITFDWGGVFTEGTFDSSAVAALASLHGVAEDDVADAYYPLMAPFETGRFDLEAFRQAFEARSGLRAPADDFRRTFLGAVRWRTPMFELLASLPSRFVVGMLSNNVPTLCDVVRGDPRMGRVAHFVFSNEIGVRKPDPAAFAALTAAVGVAPEATVFVDDNRDNIEAANALGYRGVLIDSVAGFAARWRDVLPGLPLPAGLA